MVSKLDLYRVFCIVGKNKSFTQAAAELSMTQPAVSQAIGQLERELDIRLFTRTPKGAVLTSEGEVLFEYANSALHVIDAGEKKILEYKNLRTGELKIGVGDTISKYFLLPYLEAFHTKYPHVKYKIINGTTPEIIAVLKSGDVDIGICNLPIDDPVIEFGPRVEIQDTFVYGEKYRKLLSKPIHLKELVKLPLIFLEENSNSRKYVEDFILSKGIKIAPEFELGSHELILEFAKINLGIASVTKEFSMDYLDKGFLFEVPLIETIPKRYIGVCYLKRVPLSAASTRFVQILNDKK